MSRSYDSLTDVPWEKVIAWDESPVAIASGFGKIISPDTTWRDVAQALAQQLEDATAESMTEGAIGDQLRGRGWTARPTEAGQLLWSKDHYLALTLHEALSVQTRIERDGIDHYAPSRPQLPEIAPDSVWQWKTYGDDDLARRARVFDIVPNGDDSDWQSIYFRYEDNGEEGHRMAWSFHMIFEPATEQEETPA